MFTILERRTSLKIMPDMQWALKGSLFCEDKSHKKLTGPKTWHNTILMWMHEVIKRHSPAVQRESKIYLGCDRAEKEPGSRRHNNAGILVAYIRNGFKMQTNMNSFLLLLYDMIYLRSARYFIHSINTKYLQVLQIQDTKAEQPDP